MNPEELISEIHAVAPLSKVSSLFLLNAVLFSALSAATHTRMHWVSELAWFGAFAFAILAIIKLLNRLAPELPSWAARPVHWVHALVFEVLAFGAVALLRLVPGNLSTKGSGSKPILLVHGYCNHGSVWFYLQRMWAKTGVGPVYTINLGHPFRSIREYAEHIACRAAEIRAETGHSELILIGHSMGGLVSAFYAAKLAQPGTVTAVITLGSPLGGTHMAQLALGPNGREMRRASVFVSELKTLMAAKANIRFYHLGTKTDQLVIPSEAALLGNDPAREFVLDDIGHASLLFSPRVAAKVSEWLHK